MSLKKNYFYNLVFTASNIIFPFISFTYVSRIIGPEGLGKVQFILSFAQYFSLFAALGIPIYGIREAAKYKGDNLKKDTLFFELTLLYFLTSIIISIVYFSIINSLSYFQKDKSLFLISGFVILCSFCSVDWFYIGLERFKAVTIRSLLVKAASLILLFTFVHRKEDYIYYLYIFIFSITVGNIFNFLSVTKAIKFTGLSSLSLTRHFKPLILIFSTTIATSLYTVLDTVFLGFISGNKPVGLYTVAVKLCKITIPLITSIGATTVPILSKSYFINDSTNIETILENSFNFVVFLSIPICIGSMLLAPEFIVMFSGKEFVGAVIPMQILSALPLIIGLGYFLGFQILVPSNHDKELLFSVCMGIISAVVLNFLLVPLYAETGEAIVNVITELVVTCSYFYFVTKHSFYKVKFKALFEAIVASLSFIPTVIVIRNTGMSVYYMTMISVLICSMLYLLLQTILFKNVSITSILKQFHKTPVNKVL